jgi:hypothetical protein
MTKTETQLALLDYPLVNGYLHEWLVAGPYAQPIADLNQFDPVDFKRQIADQYRQPQLPFSDPPTEQTSFALTDAQGTHEFRWQVRHCVADHLVDLTGFYATCHYLTAWAAAELEAPTAGEVTISLTTTGPVTLWLNNEIIYENREFRELIPGRATVRVALQAGRNRLLVALEQVAVRNTPFLLALQVTDAGQPAYRVRLASAMSLPERRKTLEQIFAAAYLDQDLYHGDQPLKVKWPETFDLASEIAIRLQRPDGRIYSESQPVVKPGAEITLGRAHQWPDGHYQVVLLPTLAEYHEHGLRIARRLDLQIANGKYAEAPYGTYEERRQEALLDAARRGVNVFSEIAKMALGRWSQLKLPVIEATISGINRRADCSDFYLVGLLGMLYRYGADPAFPPALQPALEACILGFKYWRDEPGQDAMCYWTENHQILFHTCEVLAGQLYPEQIFTNNGQSGAWHRTQGEARVLSWLRQRAAGGFQEWDSNCYFEEDVLALSHLADLAANDEVAEMAAIILDKLFYTMALNSFKGVFGSTHGRTYAPLIKGGRLESTAGLGRLLWGQGVFNSKILGTVSLACARSYELPPIIAQIATALPVELWSRERHAGTLEEWRDRTTGSWEVNKVTYKTPDFMLCSAQDYRPGGRGYQQHLWQATLGPDAVVFVTHPPNLSEDNAQRPNFWHGNVILPRVAQWKDALVAIHQLPEEDWLGFTHAYFPIYGFDEHALREGWAFARRGDGYLALTAAGGIELITSGQSAYRELRSPGLQNIWFVHMGRAALDGTFLEFQEDVLALDLTFADQAIHTTTVRGETLDFGWAGPLLVNEQEVPLRDFKHYDSPFCVAELGGESMEIGFGEELLRLDFSDRSSQG